jgi:hypothetical protein
VAAPAPAVPAPPGVVLEVRGGGAGDRVDPALRDAIHDAVQDELRDALAERDALAPAPQVADAAPAEPTPDEVAAAAHAHAMLADARTTGRWTRADGNALRAAMRDLTRAQRDELMSALYVAINRGELTPDFNGPPM